ncbi:AaceriAAL173Cp [[Ashbya] aceris (nom. inval.)]|nr:AaceriAAL173Cp [[Ashbya] aceris (nom. inval.)]
MGLKELLTESLPAGHDFDVLHLQSPPTERPPLAEASDCSPTTIAAQHFFTLSHNAKVFFALQVVVYICIDGASGDRVLFVSKADTNGYCDVRVDVRRTTRALLQFLLSIDPSHYLQRVRRMHIDPAACEGLITPSTGTVDALHILAQRYRTGDLDVRAAADRARYTSFPCPARYTTRLALFTRSEPHYLFAESAQNPAKHVLPGDRLLRWWLASVDDLLVALFDPETDAALLIPGEDPAVTSHYLRQTRFPRWRVGHVFGGSAEDPALARIPHFPDDPKARFLDDLADEGRNPSLRAFWTELAARQEFRLGVVVGVVGAAGLYTGPCARPAPDELLCPSSPADYVHIKHYVTAEEYATTAGASEAHRNLVDCLLLRYGVAMPRVHGAHSTAPHPAPTQDITKRPAVNDLTARCVRKKPRC